MSTLTKLVLALGLAASMGANAAVITDTVTRDPDILISTTPHSFTHILTDNGFTPGTDVFASAMVTFRLTDTTSNENFRFMIGNQTYDGGNVANNTVNDATGGSIFSFALNDVSRADLNA
ncbi:MAG TPA: hypothetical protein VIT92_09780, partial [Burkholderiaceae bacterium]